MDSLILEMCAKCGECDYGDKGGEDRPCSMICEVEQALEDRLKANSRQKCQFCGEDQWYPTGLLLHEENEFLRRHRKAGEMFVKHIQDHLNPWDDVICKICGKTVGEIATEKGD